MRGLVSALFKRAASWRRSWCLMRTRVESGRWAGYTSGMKTAISVPDPVFREAERFARRARKSRSQLYTEAVQEYLERHAPDAVTEAMNRVWDTVGKEETAFYNAASERLLGKEAW